MDSIDFGLPVSLVGAVGYERARELDAAERLARDWAGLIECFRLSGDFCTAETLRVFAIHHSAEHLVNLGWLKPATQGRWQSGYAPAGALAQELENSETH